MANVTLQDLSAGTVFYPQTTVEQVIGLGDQLGTFATSEDLESAVSEINETIETLATKEELEQGLEDLKGDILGDDLEETFNTLKEVQEWADKHGTEYATLLGTVNSLEADVEQIKKDMGDLASSEGLESLAGRVSTLEDGIKTKVEEDDYNAKVAEIEGDINSIDGRVETLESDIQDKVDQTEYDTKIDEIEAAATALEARVKALEDAKKSNVWAAVEA